eukprot:scaffold29505_cov112-Isochrysis_galbana.AAC.2
MVCLALQSNLQRPPKRLSLYTIRISWHLAPPTRPPASYGISPASHQTVVAMASLCSLLQRSSPPPHRPQALLHPISPPSSPRYARRISRCRLRLALARLAVRVSLGGVELDSRCSGHPGQARALGKRRQAER